MKPAFVPSVPFCGRSVLGTAISPRRPRYNCAPRALLGADGGGAASEYSKEEELNDAETAASMKVWNAVIHASLKRKLQGLVAENPVASGVSALMHAAPGYASMPVAEVEGGGVRGTPKEVVETLLEEFRKDGLEGAEMFIRVASESNHVKRSTPQSLVLFVGDNERYRVLLRIRSFDCHSPRFEQSGEQCVVTASVVSRQKEKATFDFHMSSEGGAWLIDEVFRL